MGAPKWKKTKGDIQKTSDEEKDSYYLVERNKGLTAELQFYGNYKETNLVIGLNEYLNELLENDGQIVLRLTMDPQNCKWKRPEFYDFNDAMYGAEQKGKREIVLMELYKTSYGYDGVNAVLFGNNKSNESMPSPQELTNYFKSTDKYNVKWIGGKTGKEDMTVYTAFYHHFGLLYCYFYDYYIPKIGVKVLKGVIDEVYGADYIEDHDVLRTICEYQGICKLMDDFIVGDWVNPYPFYRNLIISRMWSNVDKFSNGWDKFLNTYSKHRQ